MMKSWPVQDAKSRFSEFLDTCITEGPQLVTRRGLPAAVLVPLEQWQRLQSQERPTLKALLLSDVARTYGLAPGRKPVRRRKPADLS